MVVEPRAAVIARNISMPPDAFFSSFRTAFTSISKHTPTKKRIYAYPIILSSFDR
jgi:hypothetical protein